MTPRLILRTHYQVEEPAYVELLVKRCTSPVKSSYGEVVARKLAQEVRGRCARDFNEAAGAYGVDLGRALGVLTSNLTWTERGHLVDLLAEVEGVAGDPFALTPAERLLHFKLFFEADGAALLAIARYLAAHGSLSHADAVNKPIVENLFEEILGAYLTTTKQTEDRLALRKEIEKVRRGYKEKTRQHKIHLHMQTMHRLGIIQRIDSKDGINYCATSCEAGLTAVQRFVREVPDYVILEQKVVRNEWLSVALAVLNVAFRPADLGEESIRAFVLAAAAGVYRAVTGSGVTLCPMHTLISAVQVTALVKGQWSVGYEDLMQTLEFEQRRSPRDFRFHVDRRGRPAFVKVSDAWLTEHKGIGAGHLAGPA